MNIYKLVLYFDERTCEIEASHVTDDRLKIEDALVYVQRREKSTGTKKLRKIQYMVMATSLEREEAVVLKQMLPLLQ